MAHEHNSTDDLPQPSESRTGFPWVFPALLALVLVLLVVGFTLPEFLAKNQSAANDGDGWTPTPRPSGEVVALEIDFGNGATKRFEALAWQEGMTVAEVMQAASSYHPGIRYVQQGEGEGGFLLSIDGLENEGVEGKYWKYQVNGEYGQISLSARKVEANDEIRWTFSTAEPEL